MTGHLVTMSVEEFLKRRKMSMKLWKKQIDLSILLCAALKLMTLVAFVFVILLQDWWGLAVLLILVLARTPNTIIV